tara:strand:- start:280 stop:828 length:549 start_codon:yes stop_codon:yes gene_type:complete
MCSRVPVFGSDNGDEIPKDVLVEERVGCSESISRDVFIGYLTIRTSSIPGTTVNLVAYVPNSASLQSVGHGEGGPPLLVVINDADGGFLPELSAVFRVRVAKETPDIADIAVASEDRNLVRAVADIHGAVFEDLKVVPENINRKLALGVEVELLGKGAAESVDAVFRLSEGPTTNAKKRGCG